MKFRIPLTIAMAMAVAVVPAWGYDWVTVATVSDTVGINSGRLCMGLTRSDIGCPLNAPIFDAATGNLTVGGNVTAVDLHVTGNLYVSGSQAIDGVTFANGGVSASGVITATSFVGDGSDLTGVTASSVDWYNVTRIPAQVQAVSNGTVINMAGVSATNVSVTANLTATAGGTVSATNGYFTNISGSSIYGTFTGDGSGLTGVTAASADRIISGTAQLIANGNTNSISITEGGVTTGYYYGGQWVAGAISTTGAGKFNAVSVTANATVGNNLDVGNNLTVGGHLVTANVSTTGDISVTGNVSANQFIGDGSGLTNVPAGALTGLVIDRIVSGTTNIIAAESGEISVTAAGQFVAKASEDGTIFARGLLGNPSGDTDISSKGDVVARFTKQNNALVEVYSSGNEGYAGIEFAGAGVRGRIYGDQQYNMYITPNDAYNLANVIFTPISGLNGMRVGISTTTPATLLDVNGTLRIANGGEACDATHIGAIKYQSGAFYICQNTTNGWEALATTGANSLADRITSGTTQVITNGPGNSISFTVGGVTTGYFYNGQLVASAVSTTGPGKFNAVSVTTNATVGNNLTVGGHLVTANVSTTGDVSITGNVSANQFIGDGSQLTNVPASALTGLVIDRITSNTTGITAQTGGVISITSNNVNTGYFDTEGKLVLPGISVTTDNGISSTNGYFTGKIGIGIANPSYTLHAAGGIESDFEWGPVITMKSTNPAGHRYEWYLDPNAQYGDFALNDRTANAFRIYVTGNGRIGVSTTAPSTTLHVNGTLRIANGGEACDTNRIGAIKYQGGAFYICQNTTNGWEALATTGANSLADRITSGTTQVITNGPGNSISFTVGGVTTGYFYNGQLVASAVSTTGPGQFNSVSVTTNGTFGGSVGIGMTSPSNMLDVNGAVGFGSTSAGRIRLTSSVVGNAYNYIQSGNAAGDSGSWQGLAFGPYLSTYGVAKMVIDSSGLVGISTTLPQTTLDVNGSIRIGAETSSTLAVCDASRLGALKYESNAFYICQDTSHGWEPLATTGAFSASDRITSGTTNVITNGPGNSISFTVGGVTTGYFYNGQLVASAVSTTGPGQFNSISVTTNASIGGNLGIGTSIGATSLDISATGVTLNGGTAYYTLLQRSGILGSLMGYDTAANTGIIGATSGATGGLAFWTKNGGWNENMRITPAGKVGISTTTPFTTLDVAGTLKIANGGEACDASRIGAIKYDAGAFYICQNTTNGWEALATTGANSLADRITSGTTQVITNGPGNSISFTVGGVTTGYFYNGQLVASAVSTTGPGKFDHVSVTANTNIGGNLTVGGQTVLGNVSATNLDASGQVTAGSAALGALTVTGNTQLADVSASSNVSVTGNISANQFIGDGSGLTNVPADALTGLVVDRITSGTTGITANNNSSISFTTAGLERMVLMENGYIGVGTGAPTALLTLSQNSSTLPSVPSNTLLHLGGIANDSARLIIDTFNVGNAHTSNLVFRSARGTASMPTVNQAGDILGQVSWWGHGVTDYSAARAAIRAVVANDWTDTEQGVYLAFQTTPSNSTLARERLRITADGEIAIGLTSPTAELEVSGTISATYFVGDGSGLTNVPAGALTDLVIDRITSNTTGITAQTGGVISITSNNVNTGYFDATGRLVLPGISVTTANGTSSTNGYFSGNVGIGTSSPAAALHVYGGTTSSSIYLSRAGGPATLGIIDYSTSSMNIGTIQADGLTFQTNGLERLRINSSGNIGIGTGPTAINALLDISGTLKIADGGEACDASRLGALKYAANAFYICQDTSHGWEPLATTGAFSASDRITSDTTNVITNGVAQSISFTVGGVTTGYFYNGMLVASGVSTTGAVSASDAYIANKVGIGTTAPQGALHVVSPLGYQLFLGNSLATSASALGEDGNNFLRIKGYNGLALLVSSTALEAMRIDGSNGYIGIGTTNPNYSLDINGRGRFMASEQVGATSGMGLELGYSSSADEGYIFGYDRTSDAYKDMRLGAPVNGQYQVYLAAAGNVGIKNNSPTTAIDVSGTLKIADGGEACDTTRLGALKYESNAFYVCQDTSNGWEQLSTPNSTVTTDRITSGTTNVTATNNASVTFTTAGANQMTFGADGSLNIGTPFMSTAKLNFANSTGPKIQFWHSVSGTTDWYMGIGVSSAQLNYITAGSTNSHVFYAGGTNNDGTELMRIQGNGRVGIAVSSPTATLDVSGTLKIADSGEACDTTRLGALKYESNAFYICQDISHGWEPLATTGAFSASDRITSGTTNVTANNTGYISLTTGGATTGYFDTAGRLIAPGISLTTYNGISSTNGYFSGNVGIGEINPSKVFVVKSPASGDGLLVEAASGNGNVLFTANGNADTYSQYRDVAGTITVQIHSNGRTYFNGGDVGIGVNSPSATLDVSGTLKIADSGEACDASRLGALKYESNAFYICQDTTHGWENLATTGAFSASDRITSGTTNVIANGPGNSISFTVGGVTTGYFYNGQLVASAVSTTGSGQFNSVSVTTNGTFGDSVGIGITSPSYNLHVSGSIYAEGGKSSHITVGVAGTDSLGQAAMNFITKGAQMHAFGSDPQTKGWHIPARSDAYSSVEQANDLEFTFWNGTAFQSVVALDSSASYVGINTFYPSTTLDVAGTLKIANGGETCDAVHIGAIKYESNAFYVCQNTTDGWQSLATSSGSGGAADRITSGTTNVTANSTGYISLTAAGVTTGYFDTAGRLVLPGISITTANGISSTNGFFADKLAIGRSYGSDPLEVFGSNDDPSNIRFGSWSFLGTGYSGYPYFGFATRWTGTQWDSTHTTVPGMMLYANGSGFRFGTLPINTLGASPTDVMAIRNDGKIGIGTINPGTLLSVSGTLRIADGAEACDASRLGAIKYASNAFYVCQNTSNGWEQLSTPNSTVTTDRITSGTTSLITYGTTGSAELYGGSTSSTFNIRRAGSSNTHLYLDYSGPTAKMGITGHDSLVFQTESATHLAIDSNGEVGIGGITDPQVALDVSGSLKISNGGETCGTGKYGTMRIINGVLSICRQ